MGLRTRRSASRSPGAAGRGQGVRQLLPPPLPPPLPLLLLLCLGACGAAAPGEADAPTLYLWKTGKWDGVPLLPIFTPGSALPNCLGLQGGPLCWPPVRLCWAPKRKV